MVVGLEAICRTLLLSGVASVGKMGAETLRGSPWGRTNSQYLKKLFKLKLTP